jgi:hypothetical protein
MAKLQPLLADERADARDVLSTVASGGHDLADAVRVKSFKSRRHFR